MANIKLTQERYDELLEAKHILENLVNIAIEARKSDNVWTAENYYRSLDALIIPYKNKLQKRKENG